MLRDTLRWAAEEVANIARQEGREGTVVTLKIRFRGFETHARSQTLALPTASDLEIFRTAWALYAAGPWAGKPVRLIGVGISGWAEADATQADLFGTASIDTPPKEERLDTILDAISNRFGRGSVQRGLRREEGSD